MTVWAGVDVGARRKGFHGAVIDDRRLIDGPLRLPTVQDVVEWLALRRPELVAVDSPREAAPDGGKSRPEEIEVYQQEQSRQA
jgi:hypothetical protein